MFLFLRENFGSWLEELDLVKKSQIDRGFRGLSRRLKKILLEATWIGGEI